MTKLELGPVGVALTATREDAFFDAVRELEELGYSTVWLNGGPLESLDQIGDVVRATSRIRVASGIISVDRFSRDAVAATYAEIEAAHPGRFVVGLGGARGPKPLETLGAYLDELDTVPPTVPASARVLAALGPRMLQLARERAAGAIPVLVTPKYTAQARTALGPAAALTVEQFAVLETDPEQARAVARDRLQFLGRVPAYVASFRRMGFAEDDIAGLSDRLIDGIVAWGDADALAARVAALHQAGADQVALAVLASGSPDALPVEVWRQLAKVLVA